MSNLSFITTAHVRFRLKVVRTEMPVVESEFSSAARWQMGENVNKDSEVVPLSNDLRLCRCGRSELIFARLMMPLPTTAVASAQIFL